MCIRDKGVTYHNARNSRFIGYLLIPIVDFDKERDSRMFRAEGRNSRGRANPSNRVSTVARLTYTTVYSMRLCRSDGTTTVYSPVHARLGKLRYLAECGGVYSLLFDR